MGEQRYMRNVLVDGGRVVADWVQPLEEVSVTDTSTREMAGSATGLPIAADGVIERRADGGEALATVDGLHLDLDGHGNVLVNGSSNVSGNFMVIQSDTRVSSVRLSDATDPV